MPERVIYRNPHLGGEVYAVDDGDGPRMVIPMPKDLRAEGRHEVYAEIAAIDPWAHSEDGSFCQFCKGDEYARHPHGPDCLWLKATRAINASEV